jgi:hypothetical protein
MEVDLGASQDRKSIAKFVANVFEGSEIVLDTVVSESEVSGLMIDVIRKGDLGDACIDSSDT